MNRMNIACSLLFAALLSACTSTPPTPRTCDEVWGEAYLLENEEVWVNNYSIGGLKDPEKLAQVATACESTIMAAQTVDDLYKYDHLQYVDPLEKIFFDRAAQLVQTPRELAKFKFAPTNTPAGAEFWKTWKRVCQEATNGEGPLPQEQLYDAGNQCSTSWMVMKSPKGESGDFARYDELLRARSAKPFNLDGRFVATVVIEPNKEEETK